MWSFQVMNKLLQCASIYEYEDNGSRPMETSIEEETQPYYVADGNVTFDELNIAQHEVQPPQDQPPPNISNLHNINIIDHDHGHDYGMNVTITFGFLLSFILVSFNFLY